MSVGLSTCNAEGRLRSIEILVFIRAGEILAGIRPPSPVLSGDSRITAAGIGDCRPCEDHEANSGHSSDTRQHFQTRHYKGSREAPACSCADQAGHPPKDVTSARLSQLGAAILATRTSAGLSQAELAATLKTAQLWRGG
jgi:hypothetical protein